MPWLQFLWFVALSATAQQVAGSVVTAVVVAAGTYLVTRRAARGTISTSTAADLWAESRAIRTEMGARITMLEKRESELHAEYGTRIRVLETENIDLKYEVKALTTEVENLQRTVDG